MNMSVVEVGRLPWTEVAPYDDLRAAIDQINSMRADSGHPPVSIF